jgi:flagellar FliL protein
MADLDDDIDADADAAETKAAGGGLKKLLVGGGALILLVLGVVAGPAIHGLINPPADEVAATVEDAPSALTVPESDDPELYVGLHPPLVVNFQDATGDFHYMQITMEVMSRDSRAIEAVKEHTAVIRNNLILLYSNAQYEVVRTRDGKEKMLADGLQEIQAVVAKRIGTPGVEALYFTSLIIQ